MKSDILAKEIDKEKVTEIQNRIENNSLLIDEIVNKLVQDYCKQLDDYVSFIQNVLQDIDHPPTDEELDDFVMNLPVLLYFTGEGMESLGIREDTSKAVKMEKYNEVYNQVKGTIADKTALAETESQAEFITNMAYSRAYKKIKLRLDLGNELLQSIKKVITRRTSEYELGKVDQGRFKNGR
jgi:hypothetical protein